MPKPSFGCLACRRRRVKCDERIGGCTRCERYGIACPGYQDPFDVVLRHKGMVESAFPASRVADADRQDQERPLTWTAPLGVQSMTRTSPLPLILQPSMDPEQAVLGAYYGSYCVSSWTVCSLDYLQSQGNGCLWAAIKMLGTMKIHQARQLPHAAGTLLRQYANATKLLNSALASPPEARRDSTLLATLLLSMAEMKMSHDFTLHYWLMHTKGAAALLQLRGADQVLSRSGAALFLQVSSQIVIYCILGKQHIPFELQALREKVQLHVINTDHPLWQWQGLMYRFTNFLASFCAMNPDLMMKNATAIIAEALGIHSGMANIFQDAGATWEHDTQPHYEFSPLVDHAHIYYSLLSARVWNERRTATILIFAIITKVAAVCSASTMLEKEPQMYIQIAAGAIRDTALETLAAVPQMLAGVGSKITGHSFQLSANGLRLCDSASEYDEKIFEQLQEDPAPLPYVDSCQIQWPVYFAVQCELVEPSIRRCLLEILESFGRVMQIQQWLILADSVRSKLP